MTTEFSALFFDSSRGVYIPQHFAEAIDPQDWDHINPEDLETLKAGPDHEWYWEAWVNVLDNAVVKETGETLYQDGDLWLVPSNFDWEARL